MPYSYPNVVVLDFYLLVIFLFTFVRVYTKIFIVQALNHIFLLKIIKNAEMNYKYFRGCVAKLISGSDIHVLIKKTKYCASSH